MRMASASGTIILLGEHAVAYGRPAIAAAIDRGVTARVAPAPGKRSSVVVRGSEVTVGRSEALDRALEALLLAGGDGERGVEVELDVELPPGVGLGSSAAMGLAIARALDPRASEQECQVRAMAWTRVFHGAPSGVDVAASLLGGCIRFEQGTPTRRLAVGRSFVFCIGHSGLPSPPLEMVDRVARARRADPSRVDALFDATARAANEAEDAVCMGHAFRLGCVLREAHASLVSLGVSTPVLDWMCAIAEGAGALGSKLTGAGGSGAVIALANDSDQAASVLAAWKRAGFHGTTTRVLASPRSGATRYRSARPPEP